MPTPARATPGAFDVRSAWYLPRMSNGRQVKRAASGWYSSLVTERAKKHSIEEWLAQPPERRVELIEGELVERALPGGPHAFSQAAVVGALHPLFQRKPGGSGPGSGGWWFMTEPDLQLGANGYRPDVAGWRRERSPEPPLARLVTLRPDWLCEILSESNRPNDTVLKLRRYHEAGVPHYWVLDPTLGVLTVFRHQPQGYLSVLTADRSQRVRAEPFEAMEFLVGQLLGEDPE